MIAYFLGNGVGTEGTGIGLLLKGGMTGTQGYGSKEQVETARGAAEGEAPPTPCWRNQSCQGPYLWPSPWPLPKVAHLLF